MFHGGFQALDLAYRISPDDTGSYGFRPGMPWFNHSGNFLASSLPSFEVWAPNMGPSAFFRDA